MSDNFSILTKYFSFMHFSLNEHLSTEMHRASFVAI